MINPDGVLRTTLRRSEAATRFVLDEHTALLHGPDEVALRGVRGSVACAERLVAGTASEATPGDRAERFHGDRSQPAAGRA